MVATDLMVLLKSSFSDSTRIAARVEPNLKL